ncbi:permease prefix domain 1-containing protein [Paenibacillus sp. FA6]|uniref:permease prefix domain 1-containing protein n=1 Tax=Paenibacillus sp. FA6 TaxID=3413029 RepID=UPI003F6557DA
MRKIKNHVKELFNDIPASEQKELMMQDIIQNLEEKVSDLMFSGKNEEDAINKTIVEFGDIEDIKNELGTNPVPLKNRFSLHLGFSLWGSGLFIALFIFINFYYTPDTIWFVYPVFAVAWWPLSMFYKWLAMK